MDLASFIGIIMGIGCLCLGYTLDGGSLGALWLFSAALIVFGGALGSVAISFGVKELATMPKNIINTFIPPKSTISKTVDYIVTLSEVARKEGLLSIEKIIDDNNAKEKPDPLLQQGMMMVIDGVDLEQTREMMETQIYVYEEQAKNEIAPFEAYAGYAPTYGMIGTIMGLIKVLSNLDSPEEMTASIAVAFTATLYGIASANIIALPIANKLKLRLQQQLLEKEMIVEGVCSIRNGMNPKMLRDKLSIYIAKDAKAKKGSFAREGASSRIKEKGAQNSNA
ncbi:MAG: MotA/TolQ/ExbB proton channel family protein [Clostridia bacterium]|nr:MotA/TolQ/ExbB proton channel family protein [Clostridia bacterium]MDD4798288.1 MotA/TolQ/ExbB proton channel family protein [Clostridia bacterium]